MQKQQLFKAIIIVLIGIGLFLYLRGGGKKEEGELGEGAGVRVEEVTQDLSRQLGVTIPEDVERISLADISGGSATGLAIRKYEGGLFEHTILAALPDLSEGKFYAGWLVRGKEGEANYSMIATGKLRVAKSGYLLDFSSSKDLSDHAAVVVTLETKDDGKPEKNILEGSF